MTNIRVTYRRRHCYATASNQIRKVKTPGSRIVVHYVQKTAHGPHCSCGVRIQGIPALRPNAYKKMSHTSKSISRAYGGSLCHHCVKEKILRAFLSEEQKIAKKIGEEKRRAAKLEKAKKITKKDDKKKASSSASKGAKKPVAKAAGKPAKK